MKSTLFASTLAATLTATSFGQVELHLRSECCSSWYYTYIDEILEFNSIDNYGYTTWVIQVPEATGVSFTLTQHSGCCPPAIYDFSQSSPNAGPFASMIDSWNAQGTPFVWTGTFVLPAGSYEVSFEGFEGFIDFGFEIETQGSCCVNSGCSSTGETTCTELGGTWTEDGSCDDCEPVADDCPADVDNDGIPDACDADTQESVYPQASKWDAALGGNNHFYLVVESGPITWQDARDEAEFMGGHLATITSLAENQHIAQLLDLNPNNNYFSPVKQWGPWLGGYQPEDSNEPDEGWTWVTNEDWAYENWAPGEPTNFCSESEASQDYLHFNGGPFVSQWNDQTNFECAGDSPIAFVVEWSIDDCNSNGIIDSCENVPDDCGDEPCPADVDGDGSIGFSDVLIILNDWGACP